VREASEANPADDGARFALAVRCAREVAGASTLWLLMPREVSHGAFWEFGYAAGTSARCIVSGRGVDRSIFTALADCFDTDEQALSWLCREGALWAE
jgi:hypothetical protein